MQPIPPQAAPQRQLSTRPLSAWPDWEIVAKCQSEDCRPNRAIPVPDVVAAKGLDMPAGRLGSVLRCSTCGQRPRDVGLRKRSANGEVWQLVQGGPFW
jgi:hypothetical protein